VGVRSTMSWCGEGTTIHNKMNWKEVRPAGRVAKRTVVDVGKNIFYGLFFFSKRTHGTTRKAHVKNRDSEATRIKEEKAYGNKKRE